MAELMELAVARSDNDTYSVRESGGGTIVVLHPMFLKRHSLKVGDKLKPALDAEDNYVLIPVKKRGKR